MTGAEIGALIELASTVVAISFVLWVLWIVNKYINVFRERSPRLSLPAVEVHDSECLCEECEDLAGSFLYWECPTCGGYIDEDESLQGSMCDCDGQD